MDAIDCQGFAGAFTYGVVKAGFRLVGKREQLGGFGVASCEANRHLLGYDWQTEVSEPHEWTPYRVPLVFGNPPCSGFSLLSAKKFRGIDSPINECMWAFATFAGRCHPEIAIFESVQPAYKIGRPLMQRLRDRIEQITGQQYTLHHVLHNASRLGGAAIRRRYFFLVSRVPFGVDDPHTSPQPLHDTMADLLQLGNTIELQPYRYPTTSRWQRSKRADNGAVCGHYTRTPPNAQRAYDLMEMEPWAQGQTISAVARRCWQKHGRLPASWSDTAVAKLVASDFMMGFHQLHRMTWAKPSTVMTGGAHMLVMHPSEDRLLTQREIARIQGFPDAWNIRELLRTQGANKVGLIWGKGIPVESGNWIARNARAAIEGQPNEIIGEEIGERERMIDLTKEIR